MTKEGKDPYRFYRVEARELLDGMSQGVLALEAATDGGAEVTKQLLRLAHTLKGASRVVRASTAADLSHAFEDTLAPYRAGESRVPPEAIARLLAIVDRLAAALVALDAPAPAPAQVAPAAPIGDDTVRVPIATLDRLIERVAELGVRLRGVAHAHAQLPKLVGDARQLGHEPLAIALDEIARTSGVLIEGARADLADVRELASTSRLAPIANAFDGLDRMCRDAATSAGKQVALVIAKTDHRVDGKVLGPLRTALLHAIRNAVDHGIERDGRIDIEVARRGARLVITVRDDGRGIDLAAVRAAAVKSGKLAADAGLDLDGAARLLFAGGVTTAKTVTDTSGRGVGLDSVRAAIAGVGGAVALGPGPRRGTALELAVPMSLASRVVLRVVAGGIGCCLPLDAITGVHRAGTSQRAIARDPLAGDRLVDGARTVPIRELGALFEAGAQYRPTPERATLVLLGRELAVVVDRVIGVDDIVVTALPAIAGRAPIVEGGSFDDAGRPVLVLDATNVIAALAPAPRAATSIATPLAPLLPILVIDDSVTTRMLEMNILELAGYEVDVAVSAEDALQKVARRGYSLFVCDIEMPGMDGFTLVAKLHDDPAQRDVPVVLVTSLGSPEHRARGLALGARAYIVKSEFDQTRFLRVIEDVIGLPRRSVA